MIMEREDRKINKWSTTLYVKLLEAISLGQAPEDYQVLCVNHNQKKALMNKT